MANDFQLAKLGQYITVNTAANTVTLTNATFANLVSNSFNYSNGEGVGYTYSLYDISSEFNGSTKSFTLRLEDGTAVTPSNPNMLNIVIGGIPVSPSRQTYDYFHLTELPYFTSGFIVSGSTISFATPPLNGMSFYGTYRTNQDAAPAFTTRKTPFSALNIMIED